MEVQLLYIEHLKFLIKVVVMIENYNHHTVKKSVLYGLKAEAVPNSGQNMILTMKLA